MPIDYVPLLVLLVVATGFAMIAMGLSMVLGPQKPNSVKGAPCECGKVVFPRVRKFPVKYYHFAMLFIIFDVEAIFLYPWAVVFRDLRVFGLIAMSVFALVLVIAYIYVWKKGVLEWE